MDKELSLPNDSKPNEFTDNDTPISTPIKTKTRANQFSPRKHEFKETEKLNYLKKHQPGMELQRLFSILDTISLMKANGGNVNQNELCRVFGVKIDIIHDIVKYYEQEHKVRDEQTADKIECIVNTVMERITKKDIRGAKLRDKASTIKDLVTVQKLLRGEATDNIGIDWSKKSEKEINDYINVKDED